MLIVKTNYRQGSVRTRESKKAVVILAEGTENYLTDGSSYSFSSSDEDEPNAALFSKDDLTINGDGSLTVEGNYRDGIASKDDLKITVVPNELPDSRAHGIQAKVILAV